MMKRILVALFVLAGLLLAGCASEKDEMGVVARVNGRPILLSQLEFRYDLEEMSGTGVEIPSVARLQSEYSRVLSALIVQELLNQELERLDLAVTPQELKAAEDEVRQDYPDGAFEQVLVEEYIDINAWRDQLKNHLASRKFQQLVLRPAIKIDYKEAQQYYREHIAEFYMPASLKLLVIRGPNRSLVEGAVEKYLKDHNVESLGEAFGGILTREIMVSERRLPAQWKNALKGLARGQATAVLQEKFGYECLVVLEQTEASVLSPTQAYPLVEEALLQQKMAEAFEEWLTEILKTARIEVSELLLKQAEEKKAAEKEAAAVQDEAAAVQDDVAAVQNDDAEKDAPVVPEELPADGNATADNATGAEN